ncbi:MAG: hypothetical protein OHK0022_06080 [Roseiflexaceae bacterium]
MTTTEYEIGCLVVNGMNGPITDLDINQTTQREGLPTTLQAMETMFFMTTIIEGSSDEWSVSFKVNGTAVSGSTRCDIEEIDYYSQCSMIIVLYDPSIGFSVIPPKSSACLHKSYDSDTTTAAAAATPVKQSNWSGPVQCLIFNATGGPISNLQFTHSILGDSQSPPVGSMDQNGTLLYTITSANGFNSSGGPDEWSVSFVSGNVTLQRSNKQCNIEEEDFEANSCVIAALYNQSTGFSIITPVSKPCLNNSYE